MNMKDHIIRSMVAQLESKGFGVAKQYASIDQTEIKFTIAKGGRCLSRMFTYPEWLSIGVMLESYAENWVNDYIREFEEKAYLANDIAQTKKLTSALKAELKIGNLTITEYEKGYGVMHYMPYKFDQPTVKKAYCPFEIEKVIFNDPATIVFWKDGTKTVVKAVNEAYDPEKGLAMAVTKKAYGNEGNYFNQVKKYTEEYKKTNDIHSNEWTAQQRLLNAMNDKKATKKDLLAAMEEAVEYLGA